MRPICVKCQCEMHKQESGVGVIEMTGAKPYRLWSADLYQCPGCQTQVIHDFAGQPIAEHYEDAFPTYLHSYTQRGKIYYNHEKPNTSGIPEVQSKRGEK